MLSSERHEHRNEIWVRSGKSKSGSSNSTDKHAKAEKKSYVCPGHRTGVIGYTSIISNKMALPLVIRYLTHN